MNFFSSPDADESLFEIIFNKTIFSLMRLVPEQYLWVNYIKNRVHDFNYLGNNARGKELTSLSERYYINNFIPFSSKQLGFVCLSIAMNIIIRVEVLFIIFPIG